MKSDLRERKWRKFLSRVRLFRFVPFTEFVLAAGSLATGKLHENSDFDVVVGVRSGRIFTARFFAVLIFGIPGWRRKKLTHGENASDKICLSHFVTSKRYCLKPPYNDYWQNLYQSLVPVLGSREKIDEFFKANSWLSPAREYDVKRFKSNVFHVDVEDSWFKSFLTKVLSYGLGNWFEGALKNFQVKRIGRNLKANSGYKPRVVYDDDELEFHPDTKRIEERVKSGVFRGKPPLHPHPPQL